ncbi:MAG: hypothetical protein N2039_06545, partial [Gemmataceae bacterium]|nr:hypothetical protein [Gemmataceae bacterium]
FEAGSPPRLRHRQPSWRSLVWVGMEPPGDARCSATLEWRENLRYAGKRPPPRGFPLELSP